MYVTSLGAGQKRFQGNEMTIGFNMVWYGIWYACISTVFHTCAQHAPPSTEYGNNFLKLRVMHDFTSQPLVLGLYLTDPKSRVK